MPSTHCRTLEMTEYVIRQIGLHQRLVFADRRSIAFCADEDEAVKVMTEHARAAVDHLTQWILRQGKARQRKPAGLVFIASAGGHGSPWCCLGPLGRGER